MLGILLAFAIIAPTDQTVSVAKGTKLDVANFAGDVNVKTWDRDAVRVEVTHSDRETIDIKQDEQTLRVRGHSVRGGPPRSLDYTITIPRWMAVNISGTYADVTLDGVGGDVNIETTRGDIKVNGGSGFVSLKSVQGEISLEKAKGRIEVRGVNEGLRLADISGDLSAETTNGSIILDRIDSGNVDLYTVNGNISYDGPIKDKGVYRLTTHNGMIAMPVAERANATLMLRTYNGSIRSSFPLAGGSGSGSGSGTGDDARRNKRVSTTLGNGSAHVELESFGGMIALRRPGEPRPEIERRRRDRDFDDLRDKAKEKEKEKVKEKGDAFDDAVDDAVEAALANVEPSVEIAVAHAIELARPVVVPRIR